MVRAPTDGETDEGEWPCAEVTPEPTEWVTVYPTTVPNEPVLGPSGAPLVLPFPSRGSWRHRLRGWLDQRIARICAVLFRYLGSGTIEEP